ncbi:ABC transporter permease [Christensenella intestinihominis]|jgi:ribose transport system permease protein|uniref:ABC transporter permease n=1 Tax=Christensenella intestinihominis TaxID=1851429 RepID=UPI0009F69A56|nr:ABC transporter permease [Christensenella intestinihominis]
MNQEITKSQFKNTMFGKFLKSYGGLIVVILAMMVFTTIINPVFLTGSNLLQLLINNNTIFLAGLGMTFVIISGGIDLSQGALAAFATMVLAMLVQAGVPGWIAILLTIAAGGLVGIVNGLIVAYGKIHSFIATLGMTTILRGIAIAFNSGYPVSIASESDVLQFGNGNVLGVSNVLIIAIAAFVICWFILNKTNVGRDVFAVGGNAEAARFSGISVPKTTVFAFGMSGLLTALAGAIMATRMYSGVPSCATALETDAITAVIIGGTSFTGGDGNVTGTVFGTILLAVLINCMVILGISEWLQNVISGAIIIIAVVWDRIRHKG